MQKRRAVTGKVVSGAYALKEVYKLEIAAIAEGVAVSTGSLCYRSIALFS